MKLIPTLVAGIMPLASCRAYALAYHQCFPTVAQTVAQIGSSGPLPAIGERNTFTTSTGFWLEDLRRDPVLRKSWALVQNCDHPEQPPLAVAIADAKDDPRDLPSSTALVQSGTPIVRAGSPVRVVRIEAKLRLEMPAVAQSNGTIGDRVRVRILQTTGNSPSPGQEQFLVGVVRSAEVLELEN
jgi:hypothetical protein